VVFRDCEAVGQGRDGVAEGSIEFNPDYDREVLAGRCIGGIFLVLQEIWDIKSSPSGKAV
jgi:hypothetical protein